MLFRMFWFNEVHDFKALQFGYCLDFRATYLIEGLEVHRN